MKVKDKYEYDYAAINLKRHVVKRFRKLSKKFAKPQSETLDAMVDFFEWHGFSPFDKKEPSLLIELLKNRKRTEAVIAIIKDIEKNHDKPTTKFSRFWRVSGERKSKFGTRGSGAFF